MSGLDLDWKSEVLNGSIPLDSAADEVLKAWLLALKQTDEEKALPPITGSISKEKFQAAFKQCQSTHPHHLPVYIIPSGNV
jgi:hypothetical protein